MARSDLHLGRAALRPAFRFSDVPRFQDRKKRLSGADSAMPAAFAHHPVAWSNCFGSDRGDPRSRNFLQLRWCDPVIPEYESAVTHGGGRRTEASTAACRDGVPCRCSANYPSWEFSLLMESPSPPDSMYVSSRSVITINKFFVTSYHTLRITWGGIGRLRITQYFEFKLYLVTYVPVV
jgi:hypothetical protein